MVRCRKPTFTCFTKQFFSVACIENAFSLWYVGHSGAICHSSHSIFVLDSCFLIRRNSERERPCHHSLGLIEPTLSAFSTHTHTIKWYINHLAWAQHHTHTHVQTDRFGGVQFPVQRNQLDLDLGRNSNRTPSTSRKCEGYKRIHTHTHTHTLERCGCDHKEPAPSWSMLIAVDAFGFGFSSEFLYVLVCVPMALVRLRFLFYTFGRVSRVWRLIKKKK